MSNLTKYLVVLYFSVFMIGCNECVCPVSPGIEEPKLVDIVVYRTSANSERGSMKLFVENELIDIVNVSEKDTLSVVDSSIVLVKWSVIGAVRNESYKFIAYEGLLKNLNEKE